MTASFDLDAMMHDDEPAGRKVPTRRVRLSTLAVCWLVLVAVNLIATAMTHDAAAAVERSWFQGVALVAVAVMTRRWRDD